MKVRIKKIHPDAVTPKYAKSGDAGLDLTCVSAELMENGGIKYDTGLAIEIPTGYVGLVFPRSSNCKKDLYLSNAVGVIDSGYRSSITFVYKPDFDYWNEAIKKENFQERLNSGLLDVYQTAQTEFYGISIENEVYAIGDRIGQIIIMPYPSIEFEEVDELSESERGAGGYGSTGR